MNNQGIDPARRELHQRLSTRIRTFVIASDPEGRSAIIFNRTSATEGFAEDLKAHIKPDMGIQVHDHDQNRPIRITGPSIQDLNRHVGQFASPV